MVGRGMVDQLKANRHHQHIVIMLPARRFRLHYFIVVMHGYVVDAASVYVYGLAEQGACHR